MSYGLAVSTAGSTERLSEDDFIHRLWATGSVSAPGGFAPTPTFVGVAGMTSSDEWLVVTAGPQAISLGSGGFTVMNYSFSSTVQFSIYRR